MTSHSKGVSSRDARRIVFAAALGAVAFLLADTVEAKYWSWFAGDVRFEPWFLNAGRAVLFTAACIATAGFLAGTTAVREPLAKVLRCVGVTVGACVAMAVVLFVRGPGNLFPIAFVIGGAVIFIGATAGTAASVLVPS
jgi:hypothetical protein